MWDLTTRSPQFKSFERRLLRAQNEAEEAKDSYDEEIYKQLKTIAHLREQIDGNHRQFAALDELLTEHGYTIYTMQNECGDPHRRAECLLDLAVQVKRIDERLQIARRSMPDPDVRSSQRAGFALLHLDKTVYESDDEGGEVDERGEVCCKCGDRQRDCNFCPMCAREPESDGYVCDSCGGRHERCDSFFCHEHIDDHVNASAYCARCDAAICRQIDYAPAYVDCYGCEEPCCNDCALDVDGNRWTDRCENTRRFCEVCLPENPNDSGDDEDVPRRSPMCASPAESPTGEDEDLIRDLRERLADSEAQVDFLEDLRFEWRNRTEAAEHEAEEALEAVKTRHHEEIEDYPQEMQQRNPRTREDDHDLVKHDTS